MPNGFERATGVNEFVFNCTAKGCGKVFRTPNNIAQNCPFCGEEAKAMDDFQDEAEAAVKVKPKAKPKTGPDAEPGVDVQNESECNQIGS